MLRYSNNILLRNFYWTAGEDAGPYSSISATTMYWRSVQTFPFLAYSSALIA
jgi:hypothetical protein